MKKEIKKAVSKSKKLELWEQIYQMVEELKEKTDLRYLECELKRAEKELKKFKEKIAELKKKLGDLYSSISEETKVSSFKSNDMTDLFKNIKIDHLELSSMDTTDATNMNKIDLRYLERKNNLMKKEIKKLKEEALDYSEYKKAEVSIKKRIAELNEGWSPDWEKDIQQKYYIFYDNLREILDYDYCYTGQFLPNAFYLKDQKTARQIIYELEEELKLYLRY
jgi:uncharacterized protein YfkK (UPF0435 family)